MWGWFTAAWKIAAGTVAEYRRPRHLELDQIAEHVGGAAERNQVSGRCHGVAVTFRFASRGSGSDAQRWTEIEADLPASYPLAIHVRRREPSDGPRIARGALIDVALGDPAFDDDFLVEAAPADVVRMVLDARVRRMLAAHEHVALDTVSQDARRLLRLTIRGWIDDAADAIAALDRVARISARVRDSYALLDSAVPARMDGAPYRPLPSDQPARDAFEARAAEVAALEVVRRDRERGEVIFGGLILGLGLIGLLIYELCSL